MSVMFINYAHISFFYCFHFMWMNLWVFSANNKKMQKGKDDMVSFVLFSNAEKLKFLKFIRSLKSFKKED